MVLHPEFTDACISVSIAIENKIKEPNSARHLSLSQQGLHVRVLAALSYRCIYLYSYFIHFLGRFP